MAGNSIGHVVIVGGGAAGWLTAGMIAAQHQAGLRVTLIESPDVPIIGVGEGTWPSMRDTLSAIGVSESVFLRECDASFKQGSRFDGWYDGSERDYYFHPFVLPQGYTETALVPRWLERYANLPFADLSSFQPHLCVAGRAPKQPATPEYAAVANYGYHLDAGKFGAFLRKHCVEKLGVRHVSDHVLAVNSQPDGDIASLQTRAHGALEGDLFIDCTGMQSLLLGQHYGVPLIPQKHVLFNDSALAVQLPYADERSPIASQTTSTAQSAGWIWDIGLPTRRGIGHVYSSAHTSDDAAAQALQDYIAATGGGHGGTAVRKLSFEPGYRAQFWHRNCVAVGLSAGFIEPLEASALALVELSAAQLAGDMPATRDAMDIVARRFNEAFSYRWERVIEFLKLHYLLSARGDSAYWHDNRAAASVPQRLRELMQLWRHRPPSRYDFNRTEDVFPSASYQYVLYGMRFKPEACTGVRPGDGARAEEYFTEAGKLTRKMLRALPSNRELLDHIRQHGLPRV